VRLATPGITAVELWDVATSGKLLQEWRDDPAFAVHLAAVVEQVRVDPPAVWSAAAREAAGRIAHVHFVGGGVTDETVAAIALPATRSRDPFAAARAGARRGAVCADLGQTGIKLVHGERAWRVERDLARAPMRDDTPIAERGRARTTTIEFIAAVLGRPASQITLALPCELDEVGRPRSCSYCWSDPDPHLIGELEAATGCAIDYLNDAELAALAAQPELPANVTTLVLTIGFAVGGAIVSGTSSRSGA
jgi:hypothetical protein